MLSLLLIIPIIGSLVLLPISEESETGVKRIKQIVLATSMVNFILSLVLWGEFDCSQCFLGLLGFYTLIYLINRNMKNITSYSNYMYCLMPFLIHDPVETERNTESMFIICYIFITVFSLMSMFVYLYIKNPFNLQLKKNSWLDDFYHGYIAGGMPLWWVKFSKTYFAIYIRIAGSLSVVITQLVISNSPYFAIFSIMRFFFFCLFLQIVSGFTFTYLCLVFVNFGPFLNTLSMVTLLNVNNLST